MQDESNLKSSIDTMSVVTVVMGLMTLAAQLYGVSAKVPVSFYFYLGLVMMATSVALVISSVLRAVYGRLEGLSGAVSSGILALIWFANGAAQFGHAAFGH